MGIQSGSTHIESYHIICNICMSVLCFLKWVCSNIWKRFAFYSHGCSHPEDIPIVGHSHFSDSVKFPEFVSGNILVDTLVFLLLKHMVFLCFPLFFHKTHGIFQPFFHHTPSHAVSAPQSCQALQCPICIRTPPRPSTRLVRCGRDMTLNSEPKNHERMAFF